jgi:hypothetical protein
MTLLLQMTDMTNPLISFPYAYLHPDNLSFNFFICFHIYFLSSLYIILSDLSPISYWLSFPSSFIHVYYFHSFSLYFIFFQAHFLFLCFSRLTLQYRPRCTVHVLLASVHLTALNAPTDITKKKSILDSSWNLTFKNRASYI